MYVSTGELSKRFNISMRTIRYYDQIDLVSPSRVEEGGKRFYSGEDCFLLEKVLLLKSLDLPLEEIKKIVTEESTETILLAHKTFLEEQLKATQASIAHTTSLINILSLEGTIHWEELLSLVLPKKETRNWSTFFSEKEQETLQERLPKLEQDSMTTKKWMNMIKRIELCIQEGFSPGSAHAKLIVEDMELLSEETFQGDQNLMMKFWDVRRSQESSSELNLYPVKQEIIDFIEKAYDSL